MMLSKLNSGAIDALIQSAKSNNDFLENVSARQLRKLDEHEIQEYVLRRTQMKDKIGAIFKGKSLCINKEHVKKISSIFEKMNKNFYVFVIK